MALTAKQERFARLVAEGRSQADAYRMAYNAEKMGDNAIRVAACRLMDNANVALMVASLMQKAADATVFTKASYIAAQRRIAERWEDADSPQGVAVASAAYERAAKAAGFLVEKVESSGDLTVKVVRG